MGKGGGYVVVVDRGEGGLGRWVKVRDEIWGLVERKRVGRGRERWGKGIKRGKQKEGKTGK